MTLTRETVIQTLSPRPVRFFEQIGSTNDEALAWLRQDAPAGAVVIADEQTAGRGRLGRSWYAPPGTALMLSILLRPQPLHAPQVTMVGALAVYDLVQALGLADVALKWPNDLLVNRRKVSGILLEADWQGRSLLGVALGIGLNVRTDFTGTPFADTAISLEAALGKPLDRLKLLVGLLSRVDHWLGKLGSVEVFTAWQERMTMLGRQVTVTTPEGVVIGVADSVDEGGSLYIRTQDGTLKRVVAGDIQLGG